MFHEFPEFDGMEDELFLAPETTVSLHFDAELLHIDTGARDDGDDWDIDRDDALGYSDYKEWADHKEWAGREPWAHRGLRGKASASSRAGIDSDAEEQPMTLRDAMRRVMELP